VAKRPPRKPIPANLLSSTSASPPSVQNPLVKATQQAQDTAIQSLKDNLKNLNDLHSRLRFMLQELEELVKE
jgi:hypothetical protein